MKKTIIALLILVFAASSCFAAFIQIGPTARYNGSYTDVEEMKDIKNYEFGADARVNLGLFGVAANALFSQEGNTRTFNTIMTANLRAEFSILELSIGAGFDLPIVWDKDTGDVLIGFGENQKEISHFLEVFENSDLLLRAAVGVNLGGLGVSADCKLPLSTIKSYIDKPDDTVAFVKKGRVAVSMLINLF